MEQANDQVEIFGEEERNSLLDKARKSIKQALDKGLSRGPSRNYSDQVITWTLRDVGHQAGYEYANALIEEFELEGYGWDKQEIPESL